jgi:hypothetical protein
LVSAPVADSEQINSKIKKLLRDTSLSATDLDDQLNKVASGHKTLNLFNEQVPNPLNLQMCLKDPSNLQFPKNPALLNTSDQKQDLVSVRDYLMAQKLPINMEQKMITDLDDQIADCQNYYKQIQSIIQGYDFKKLHEALINYLTVLNMKKVTKLEMDII